MEKITLRIGETTRIKGTDVFIKNIDKEDCKSENGNYFNIYLLKLLNGKNSFKFEFSDSINTYEKNEHLNVNDVLHCLIQDLYILEDVGTLDNEDIDQYLIDIFDYRELKEIKRVRKALIHNYKGIESVFTGDEITTLKERYENY